MLKLSFGEDSTDHLAPDYFLFRKAVCRRPNTAPGPDELPFAAWQAAGDTGILSFTA